MPGRARQDRDSSADAERSNVHSRQRPEGDPRGNQIRPEYGPAYRGFRIRRRQADPSKREGNKSVTTNQLLYLAKQQPRYLAKRARYFARGLTAKGTRRKRKYPCKYKPNE